MKVIEYFENPTQELSEYLWNRELPAHNVEGLGMVFNSIGHFTYGMWAAANDAMNEGLNDYELMIRLLTIFHWNIDETKFDRYSFESEIRRIDNIDINFAFPIFKHYIELINNQRKQEEKNLYYKMTNEEISAGFEELGIFGYHSTCINMGKTFGVKPTEIYDWNYMEVYLILWYDNIESRCKKNYKPPKEQ